MSRAGNLRSRVPGEPYLGPLILLLAAGCGGAVPSTSPVSPNPSPTASPFQALATQTPAPFTAGALAGIVVTADTLPYGMTIDDELTGQEALVQPVALLDETSFAQQPGFVDAAMTRLGTSGPGSYWEEGGYVTWATLYLAPAAAAAAFEVLVDEHLSGWGMEAAGRPRFAGQGVTLQGPAYGVETRLHIWRAHNMLLATAALGPATTARMLDRIAAAMYARSNPADLSHVVLDAGEAPEGTNLDESRSTPAAAIDRVVVSGRESQFQGLPGLQAARYSEFSGDGGLFLSLGIQFDTATNADRAFDLFLDELVSKAGYGLDVRKPEQVGDEGRCTEGANRDLGGVHERICLWRRGPLILVAGGTLSWTDTYELARGMDSRAR